MRLHWLVRSTLLGIAVVVGCKSEVEQPSQPVVVSSPLDDALRLKKQGQPAAALKAVRELLIASPDDSQALLLAMELHQSLEQYCEAAELGRKIAEADPRSAVSMLVRVFDWHLRCGDFVAAEGDLNRAIELAPRNPQTRRLLAQLLNAQGRRYEASEHVRELIRLKVIQPNELFSLVDLSGPFSLVSYDGIVDRSQTSLFLLGEARYLYVAKHSQPEEITKILDQILQRFPDSTATVAFQGRVLAETGQQSEFEEWLKHLPAGIETEPEYWNALGNFLSQQDRHREAIRAFAEAVRLDPTDRGSLRAMVHSLEIIEMESQAVLVRERLATLDEIFHIARESSAEQAKWVSDKLNELARPWESAAWLMYAAQLSGQLQQQIPELERRGAAIAAWERGATTQQIRTASLKRMLSFDVEAFPLPDLKLPISIADRPAIAQRESQIRFDDVAKAVGLATQFESGFPVDGGEFFAYQVNGGGLAVLDYDLDGRSDVYVVQSGGLPNDPTGSTANQLFRLLPGQVFSEVTDSTATGDRGFGQGVCAGDVNQDGFADLLIANIGANVILMNQGDGTFRQADDLLADNADRWTSCLGLADLDGDSLPEIIEVNYIDDPQVYVVECGDDHLPCQPQRFNAASDRVYRCLADGKFIPWSGATNIHAMPKLGFGLVIANFDRQYGNDFFVANDGNVNHFWTSVATTDSKEQKFQIVEAAAVRGCGIGRGGDSQACMGVASGDFNRDGTLDLHVTNFTSEPVNLFLQTKSGFFTDEALKYGLVEPSFGVLGFGTQSADFDNDGWLDLAVLNGHVYDARRDNIAYRMRPQIMAGSQPGFSLLDVSKVGDYWQSERLGRTLATLDWNRDGRIDLLANHLDEPVSLLENNSPTRHWLQLELVGVASERDAIGAEVRVQLDSVTLAAWQIGGDGYMCSNESLVHFGLGEIDTVNVVEVVWPNGSVQRFEHVEANARYLIIEGEKTLERRFQ